jgi:phosphoglycolate phosphatase
VFVVGDTPHDVECARAIGARTIAVATGGYTLDELRAYDPWRAFDELPPPEEFVTLIDGAAGDAQPDASRSVSP